MWQPVSLKLINFISHKETFYQYRLGSLDLIQGINLSDPEEKDGEESNGSGKSTILEASYYALIGDCLREDIVVADLIMNGENESEIEFILTNHILQQNLKIQRKIVRGSSAKIKIWLTNSELDFGFCETDEQKFAGVEEGAKLIIKLIGVKREDLINYFIISKKKYCSYYKSSDPKKKEIISRFSGADLVEGVDKLIDKDIKDKEKELGVAKDDLLKINTKIESYQEQIDEAKNEDAEVEKTKKIDEIKTSITEEKKRNTQIDIDIKDIEKKITEKTKEKTELEKQCNLLSTASDLKKFAEIEKSEGDVEESNKKTFKLKEQSSTTLKEYQEFDSELDKIIVGSVDCPKCGHWFNIGDKEINVEVAKEQKAILAEQISTISIEIKGYDDTIFINNKMLTDYNKQKKEIREKISKIEKSKSDLQSQINNCTTFISIKNNSIKSLVSEIDTNLKSIERHLKEIKDIENKVVEDKIPGLQEKLDNTKLLIPEAEVKVKKIEADIIDKNKWKNYFVSFKSFLANKAIKTIEGYTNFYLQKMECNLAVTMDGYGLLADGKTVREKITTNVMRDGILEGTLGKFSEGEKAKIEISTILALQKLINIGCDYGKGLDLLCIDEILESVSKVGMIKIVDSLLHIENTVLLITHVNMEKDFANISRFVVKENGISKLMN